MAQKLSKKGIAQALSGLKAFEEADARSEQYPTDSEVAADALWNAYMHGDIEGKTIADLGAGTGILGIGALILGANKVFFVEKDDKAMKVCMDNFEEIKGKYDFEGEAVFISSDIKDIDEKADTVVQNPPFGTREKHADREFLEKAFETAPVVYSFHKSSTEKFVRAFSDDKGFPVSHRIDYDFALKKTMKQHTRRIHRIKVSLFRMQRKT